MSNKVIEYLITAKDKTAAAVKSATEGAKKYGEAVKKTGADTKKAGEEAVAAFNPMDMIFQAASGNIDGMAKQVAGLLSKLKLLQASMMTIGLYAALIAVVVKAFKAWNEAAIDAVKSVSEFKNQNFDNHMKQLADEQARYNKELERTNKALQDERQHEDALAEASKNRQLAQLEIERQKAIAAGGNIDEINERFNQSKADVESKFNAAQSQESIARLNSDIDSMYQQIQDYRDQIKELEPEAREQIRLAASSIHKANDAFFWNRDDYNELAKGHTERAERANGQIQDFRDKIADLEQQIRAKENRIEQINAGTGARGLQEQASQMERDNAVDARLKKEEEARAKEEEAREEEIQRYYDELAKWQAEQDKMMQDALREEEAARMAMIQKEHRERLANQQKEIQAAQQEQQSAQSRLQAAQAATATAWGWYRDKNYDALHSNIELQKREAAAEASFAKDFERLKRFNRDWRTMDFGKLSDDQEAVRQVALAREEEAAAARWAEETAANTAFLQQIYAEMQNEE